MTVGAWLVRAIVICDEPPAAIAGGEKLFVTLGAGRRLPDVMVNVALASVPGFAFWLVTGPVWLTAAPCDVPTTLTTTLQVFEGARTPAASETRVAPGSAVTVPPHVLLTTTPLLALAMCSGVG